MLELKIIYTGLEPQLSQDITTSGCAQEALSLPSDMNDASSQNIKKSYYILLYVTNIPK